MIRGVHSTCGCTTAGVNPRALKPGESIDVKIVFHPQGKLDEQRETVTIVTGTSPVDDVAIGVWAVVDPPIRVSPKALYWDEIAPERGASGEVVVTGPLESFGVSNVVWDGPAGVETTLSEESEVEIHGVQRRCVRIGVVIREATRPGPFQGSLLVRTNDALRPLVSVTVGGWVLGQVRCDPTLVRIDEARAGRAVVFRVMLDHRAGLPFGVKRVQDLARPGLAVDWKAEPAEVNGRPVQQVTISLPTSIRAQAIRGQLVFETDQAQEPAVRLPFNVSLAPP